jgi:hypothetical protein
MVMTAKRSDAQEILRHWREAVPNDRLAHLVKDAARSLVRALSVRLAEHQVSVTGRFCAFSGRATASRSGR